MLGGSSAQAADVLSQGSILSPLLFLIFMDDIVKPADDILLYHPIACVVDHALLQSDLNPISAWVASNCMSFNAYIQVQIHESLSET